MRILNEPEQFIRKWNSLLMLRIFIDSPIDFGRTTEQVVNAQKELASLIEY
jgi:hypothetical protein